MFRTFWHGICELFYPNNCVLCHRGLSPTEKNLCEVCQNKLQMNYPPFCRSCSRHLDIDRRDSLCRECQKNPHQFDRTWAAMLYNETMKEMIHLFKYANKTSLRMNFINYMLKFIEKYHVPLADYQIIIPVPLHPARQRERGYNQSEFLAQGISEHFHIPLCDRQLIRSRHTPHQALLSEKDRWTNIRDAFKIKQPQLFKDQSILIVDDLMSTGATVSEMASVLKSNGAKGVAVLTAAIAY